MGEGKGEYLAVTKKNAGVDYPYSLNNILNLVNSALYLRKAQLFYMRIRLVFSFSLKYLTDRKYLGQTTGTTDKLKHLRLRDKYRVIKVKYYFCRNELT